ncbi:50S ribosomal protein L13 [Maridesulfovibrio ferrireducens]|uniref:Large ribosomal subunit protein uL13 n=1 Tax=Maridesulfovibrio ferrireducens TaxID=246191 RepID=A0A1G9IZS5_9BACT|nr:50S ribosomal protein L13 [Maridesulfovibrio ferrireducens]MBI9112533.1 50S ribosomal protein L13 [Maridesulfovibrio ferrireducens]SDL30700.1 large subunit ribosomal protein L13 [Maridesulfovibrio ferrireducens]
MKTYIPKSEDISREWYVVDATDMVLGRLATRIATKLRGKDKAMFTPHADTGDFVIVLNADKIRVTGNKLDQKTYYKHTNHPGGIKSRTLKVMLEKKPEVVIETAVRGMLPKSSLGRQMIKKLKVYTGTDHPHEAQLPKPFEF